MQIAFYKGPGRIFDKLIRWWTRSEYSHCELVFSDGVWFSASPRDGGCRYKQIAAVPGHWDFKEIPLTRMQEGIVRLVCTAHLGKRYDWLGILCSQIIPLNIHSQDRWFCSEFCTMAFSQVGLLRGQVPCKQSTADLYRNL